MSAVDYIWTADSISDECPREIAERIAICHNESIRRIKDSSQFGQVPTLRDQFAMAVVGGFLARDGAASDQAVSNEDWDEFVLRVAQASYEIADAMIQARQS